MYSRDNADCWEVACPGSRCLYDDHGPGHTGPPAGEAQSGNKYSTYEEGLLKKRKVLLEIRIEFIKA